jgi:hypothetical protein
MTAQRPDPDGTDPGRSRVAELSEEYQVLQHRYGILEPLPELVRVNKAVERRRTRLKELEEELGWLESEIESFKKGRELLLVRAIDEVCTRFKEAWSPTPVLGYRLWLVSTTGFFGVRQRWTEPTLAARCLETKTDDEVPHTDGRCGPRGCGIYAAKDPRLLLDCFTIDVKPPDLLGVGLVGLSGKVVEHQHGYRAAHVTVLALALTQDGINPLLTDNADQIRDLFDVPALYRPLGTEPNPPDPCAARRIIVDYLEERERNHTWTSENKNE